MKTQEEWRVRERALLRRIESLESVNRAMDDTITELQRIVLVMDDQITATTRFQPAERRH
jgi:hypothetical protein